MAIIDILLTPLYMLLFYAIAFIYRPYVTNKFTNKIFIPALTVKFIGSISFVLIFLYYYGGGDTVNYYIHSTNIFNSFSESPKAYFKLLLSSGEYDPDTAKFVFRPGMWWYKSHSEFFVAKVAAIFALFCFNSFTVISLFFAFFCFSELWALFSILYKLWPELKTLMGIAVFFIPSTFFWGSGLMKDSLCMGAMGWLIYSFYNIIFIRKTIAISLLIFSVSAYSLAVMKLYILLCLLPALVLWVFLHFNSSIKSQAARVILRPFFLVLGAGAGYLLLTSLAEGDKKYDIDKLGQTAQTTAEYLYNLSVSQQGSAYSIGELDGTLGGMIKLAPQAIIVSLFRPFIWEVKNPVMLLSALESMWFTFLTVGIFYKAGFWNSIKTISKTPFLVFCFVFSLVFAFAVGSTSFNFGTLVRYKIPLIPFYLSGLFVLRHILQTSQMGRYRKKRKAVAITANSY